MLKNQFLFAYKNFDEAAKKDFLKTYIRNVRRSLWVYIKDRSKTEAIHKARLRSSIWNALHIFGTIQSRHRTMRVNPSFNYSHELYTKQPLNVSFIIDATGKIDTKKLDNSLRQLFLQAACPSEIIVVTDKDVEIPEHSPFITVRNIVDKKFADITVTDYAFMCSNTDILISTTFNKLLDITPGLSDNLITIYRAVTSGEAAIVVHDFSGSDQKIANNNSSKLVAIRKSDFVNFLTIHDYVYSITDDTIGEFINWVVMECKPIARIKATNPLITREIHSPASSFPVLNSLLRWNIKKVIRKLHLARILSKLKKIISHSNASERLQTETQEVAETSLPMPSKASILATPIFINTRDITEPLIKLLQWLGDAGYKKIIFVDNDSTYPGLLDIFSTTPYQVIPLGRNGMQKAPWESFAVRFFAKDQPYIVTDPDVVPTPKTPKNTIEHLYKVLYTHPSYKKAGAALKIDDMPDHYSMKQYVIEWESRYWDPSLLIDKDIYRADVDTTFALYREKTWWLLSPSMRVGGIYAMHHYPWYQNLDDPSDDMIYYKAHASNDVSTWVKGKLPKHHLRAMKKEGFL